MSSEIWLVALPILIAIAGLYLLQRQRARSRDLYQEHLERALSDGILSEQEAEELAAVRAKRDLSEAEVRMVAVSLYRRALKDAVEDSRITEQEDESLQRMRAQLGLSDADLASDVQQMQRVRVLADVERGHLPHVHAPVALADGETCHWAVQGRIADPLLVPGRRTTLRAISFDVENGPAFSVAGERSTLATSSEILPVDIGLVVITNRRTIFHGARKNVSIPHMKLHTLDLFQDGIALDETDPAHTSFLLVIDPEIAAAILLSAARKRQAELKNLTTRSA